MTKGIHQFDDIIDSRDVIARIEELTEERERLADAYKDASSALTEMLADDGNDDFAKHMAALAVNQAQSAWAAFNESDEATELKKLQALADEASGYAADWKYGEALIRDSYFKEYAQEFAKERNMIPRDLKWPCTCIDWDQAARELQQDYTSVDFAGVTYWVR